MDCLTQSEGVGFRTAPLTLVFLTELGAMNRGGRAQVRPVLYMAALSASQCNSVLAPFYQGLKKRGKPSKVALTASGLSSVRFLFI